MGADVLGGLAWPQGKGLLIVVFWRRPVGKRWGQVGCLEGTKEVCETTKVRRPGRGTQELLKGRTQRLNVKP